MQWPLSREQLVVLRIQTDAAIALSAVEGFHFFSASHVVVFCATQVIAC